MRFKYILFDLDGTLTESGPGIINSVLYSLEKFGIEVKDKRELFRFIGPPLVESYMEYCHMPQEQACLAIEYYREYFEDKGILENSAYEGVTELLRELKDGGFVPAIATAKPEGYAKTISDHFGFTENVAIVCGSAFNESTMTKADVIRNTLEILAPADKSEVLMVGDRHHDVEGAHESGILCAGILYGYGTREELETAGADYIFGTVAELRDFLFEE